MFGDRQLRRLMLALAVTCMAGWLFKAHCLPGGWTNAEQYTSGCYSDAIPFWGGRGVAAGEIPYFEARLEYPVLTGLLIWIEGALARLLPGGEGGAPGFLAAVTAVNALLAALVLWLFHRAGMDARRLRGWAFAPPLVLYLGHNWDMLAVAFAIGALLLARDGKLIRAAATAGLGVAAKLFPIVMLPLIGLQALERRGTLLRRLALGAAVAAAAVGAWALVNAPPAIFAFEKWSEFYTFSQARPGTAASVWELLAIGKIWTTSIPERNLYASIAFALGAAAIVALGWRQHHGRLWVLFAPVLAWFMLTNKVWSPQFDLWLYPVLLMTAPRLAPVALFAAAGIAAYFAEFWFFASLEGGWPAAGPEHIAIAAVWRAAAMLWLIADALQMPPPAWIAREREAEA